MILRPLERTQSASTEFLPAWSVVERIQRQANGSCWMITQPSHAALAGEFAAKLNGASIPKLDAGLIRSIALHDAGWGVPDAQAIMQSRSVGQGRPKSFIECNAIEFLAAWEKSIGIAASTDVAGGYIVSRHFTRLGEHGLEKYDANEQPAIKSFLKSEAARQKQLVAKQNHSTEELERLTDVLQFCDLLSLYVCSGAPDNAEFPEFLGAKTRLTVRDENYKLEPTLIEPGSTFNVAALRHPATKGESGKEIKVKIG